jgi:outer membrane receptor for ferrienterochelin and colicins
MPQRQRVIWARRFASLCVVASTRLAIPAYAQSEISKSARVDAEQSTVLDSYYKLFQRGQQVTAASKTRMRVDVAPAVVTVLPHALLVARGFRTVGEALASVPGLFVLDNLVTYDVSVRGINLGTQSFSRGLKFLVNGATVTYEALGGVFTGPEFIPIDVVDTIEVIRGPASALYGANAFLGVVNVVTQRPAPSTHSNASAEGGFIRNNPAYHGGGYVHVAGEGGKAYFLAAASAGYEDRSGLVASTRAPARLQGVRSQNDLARPLSVFGRGVTDLGDRGELTLQVMYQQLDTFGEFSDIDTLNHHTRLVWANTLARLEHRVACLDDRLELRSYVSGARGEELPRQRLDVGAPAYIDVRERTNAALGGGTELTFKTDTYSGLAGVEVLGETHLGDTVFQQQRTAPDQALGSRLLLSEPTTFFFTDVAGYVQASVMPTEALSLWGGLRYDGYSRWRSALSWRAAATYSASDDLHFKLLYGTSFVPPAPAQVTAVLLNANGIQGNPLLQPQTASTLEASATWILGDFLNLQLNAFWTRVFQRVEYVRLFVGQQAQNLSDSSTLGAEANAEVQYGLLTASANVSYANTTVNVPLTAPSWFYYVYGEGRVDKSLMPSFPAWMGHLTAGVLLADYNVQAMLGLNVIGTRGGSVDNAKVVQASYALPGYATLDAHLRSMALHIGSATTCALSLHATNLLNQRYDEPGNRGTDVPSRGRSLYFKAQFVL